MKISRFIQLALLAFVILVGAALWVALRRSAGQSVLPNAVVPWPARAEKEARRMLDAQGQMVATSILNVTHPSGKNPSLAAKQVLHDGESLVISLDVAWKGGILGTPYTTRVQWRFDKAREISAKVIGDNSPTPPGNAQKLSEYFANEIYPVLKSNVGN